ncbi:DUF727 domain containing protein [Asbolus verrucosus]|uniref:DUF727 domain containing protein n=1 Tax=Asbolus verrucosus TaxID=1661398 RepID=A0A482VP26_ASBVE|nr:DUF727 domain containing protein [Asbolus verrucosus]
MSDQVLDAENWKVEANAVAKDIENHVKSVVVLDDGTDECVYFNLTTLEGRDFCIELSASGFRVAGTKHSDKTSDNDDYFETPYGLLNQISELFHQSFGNELLSKLNNLKST